MDSSPLFLTKDDIVEFHSEQITSYGGLDGLGDSGLLDSAVASPQHLYQYNEKSTLFDLATAYAFHISKNHAFLDGNKRTGLQAAIAFLKGNGYDVEISEENLFEWMLDLAVGGMSRPQFSNALCACSVRERGLTAWIRTLFPG